MLFTSLSFFMLSMGSMSMMCLGCGIKCSQMWTTINIPCVIFTAIVQFNKTGRLCGDVEIESNYKGDGLFVDGWTFNSDKQAMMGFWIFQLTTSMAFCYYANYPNMVFKK